MTAYVNIVSLQYLSISRLVPPARHYSSTIPPPYITPHLTCSVRLSRVPCIDEAAQLPLRFYSITMGYFASGWPKTYVLPQRRKIDTNPDSASGTTAQTHPVHAIHLDPSDHFVLTVSPRALHIWSAGPHRVLLAQFIASSIVLDEEGPLIDAAWSPNSSAIIAAFRSGLLLLFSVSAYTQRSILHFNDSEAHVSSPNLYPLRLVRVTELRIAHANASITALTACPAGALVAMSSAALSCVSWDADVLWRAHVPELLRHNNAMTKMGVVPNGALSPHPVLARIQKEVPPDSAGGIVALAYSLELSYCALVLADGPALLLAMHSAGHTRPSAIDGRWLRSCGAVSIALEPRRMLASVGLDNGDVEQYYIGVPAGDQCPLMRTISLSPWFFEPSDIGKPMVLRWSEDGAALIVGWENRGLAVWSASGCRLMWTLPQVGGTLPTTPSLRNRDSRGNLSTNPMEQGVLAAAWGPQGYCLWASPRFTQLSPPNMEFCHFMEFSFFKSSSGGSLCQSDSSRLAILGSDRILMLWHAHGADEDESGRRQTGAASSDLFSWQQLLIPYDYLWRNWPPTNVAVSSDASYVAVAGEHGVAICHLRTQRWRVFGDDDHGSRIKCSCLAWVGKTIVIGNEIAPSTSGAESEREHELLFYLRDHGDANVLQTKKSLPSRPVLSDVRADGYLLVMCEDARVFLFKMTEHYSRGRVDVREVYTLLLPTRESGLMYRQDHANGANRAPLYGKKHRPAPGGGITEAKIFPPLMRIRAPGEPEAPTPTHIMLLRSTGSLILLDTELMVSTALLRYVERFWYTPVDCTPFDIMTHRPVWWAYGDDGLHVCFQDGSHMESGEGLDEDLSPVVSGRKKKVEVEQWFELDAEVYPLAIMSKYGMVLGATQGLVNKVDVDGVPIPSHTIQVKRLPTLHTLLRHLLMRPISDERLALQVALKCVAQPQFVDSLEWLLYEAVLEHDDENGVNKRTENGSALVRQKSRAARAAIQQGFPESPRRRHAGSGLFPRVIRLLKYFGEYEDVVVRCARKLDSKRWPLLFSMAGEPAALLEQCFVSGRLRTAACLLVILQEMWGFISSTPHSLRLVEAALGRGEVDLAADLANFLAKADRAGMLNSSQLRAVEDVSWVAEALRRPSTCALRQMLHKEGREVRADRIPAVDLAVLNHSRWLLNRMDFRNLVSVSLKMDFPLDEWLKRELKERSGSRPFVRDFGSTILSLHRQFQCVEPELSDVRQAMKVFNAGIDATKTRGFPLDEVQYLGSLVNGMSVSEDYVGDADHGASAVKIWEEAGSSGAALESSSSLDDVSEGLRRSRARTKFHLELSYLMTVCRLAGAPDLTLLCATLLLDISTLRTVLRAHEELFGPYVAALNEFNVSGYDALLAVVNEVAVAKS